MKEIMDPVMMDLVLIGAIAALALLIILSRVKLEWKPGKGKILGLFQIKEDE